MASDMTILSGDCRETLKTIPDGSVHCCVSSPPYWGLRSYLSKDNPLKHLEIGSEPTPDAFVETMVTVFREVKRCLHPTGVLFLNLGDSYAGSGNGANDYREEAASISGSREKYQGQKPGSVQNLKPKDLCMIPWRVALALQADGWWLRSIICWHKKSCMPESVTDRPTNSWEPIFLLAKSQKYFYDAVAIQEPAEVQGGRVCGQKNDESRHDHESCGTVRGNGSTRNCRNVWSLGPEPYSEAHFATFPTEIPRRAILAGTSARGCCPKCYAPWERVVESEAVGRRRKNGMPIAPMPNQDEHDGGSAGSSVTRTIGWQRTCDHALEPIPCTVLDPFGGSGTVGQVATELGRKAILCELNDAYIPLIETRTNVTKGLALA